MTTDYHHYMQLPREVIVGNNILSSVTEVTQRLNLKGPALIISGKKSYNTAGRHIQELLKQKKIKTQTIIINTKTNSNNSSNSPTTENMTSNIEQKIAKLKPQVLLAIGGGSIIDLTKISSHKQGIPFISIPTTISHDGIASPLASIKQETNKPYSIITQAPLAIIADTDAISQAPWRSVISGCGDIIAKYTSVKDWNLAHIENKEYYGEYAANLAQMSAKLITKNAKQIQPKDTDSLHMILEALISCGVSMSIAGSSRPCSGAEHLFSHALDIISPNHAMHGEQVGVGTILTAYLQEANWEQIRETLKQIGAPTTAKELGVKDEDVIKALEMAPTIRPERYTILHKLQPDYETCKKVTKETKIID
ncbi:MAG: NAD(P)-dependent glycerol-1-phosphate dehydrogenase [Candidatus Bathyarchaeota archaeon]|nr:NAD(P)-dependent glycerol-1-phosphate dehydrogenase [Candidatus Termiticorpusculum sp.]MCL1970835.1 NAD(P)-dependent glycerol-1-phosphate dehydrogenase [Candidatus Termiticorpusculum sp.]